MLPLMEAIASTDGSKAVMPILLTQMNPELGQFRHTRSMKGILNSYDNLRAGQMGPIRILKKQLPCGWGHDSIVQSPTGSRHPHPAGLAQLGERQTEVKLQVQSI